MASPLQLTANRANAQLSTGPTSSEGKTASAANALKFGIYSEALIMRGEDPAHLEALTRDYHAKLKPIGADEIDLVEQLIRCTWLKRRYMLIETAILNHLLEGSEDPLSALGAIYTEAVHNGPLTKASARLQAVTNTWFRAHNKLIELQQLRREAEQLEAPAETTTAPIFRNEAKLPAPPPMISKQKSATSENLALRL